MDQLFSDLNAVTNRHDVDSVHLALFPEVDNSIIDEELETQMEIAQKVSSLVLGIRKKERIRVRQPLQTIMVPTLNEAFSNNINHVKDLILSEVNVKELKLIEEGSGVIVKSIKPNFKTIGPKYGKQMKAISALVGKMTTDDIAAIEKNNGWNGEVDGQVIELDITDFEILAQDIPGWLVSTEGALTVALDITISETLRAEGIARELVNRVQNLRKDSGLEITDRILLKVDTNDLIQQAINANKEYVCNEILANGIVFEALGVDALTTDLEVEGDAKVALVKG
jgi:isoleucyl-tRNA synthetase